MTSDQSSFRVAIVTGTRAEFGLLLPVIDAIQDHEQLDEFLIVTGLHLLDSIRTVDEIRERCPIGAEVRMQKEDEPPGRSGDVQSLARGISGLGSAFDRCSPDVILVLGDRIEAFAAATAGSVGGFLVAHIHGGDRAEGVADEAMRHAITKIAHIHFPATPASADRIARMGEPTDRIFCVGSPAIDGLDDIEPISDAELRRFELDPSLPFATILHHPSGLGTVREKRMMQALLEAVDESPEVPQSVLFAPNRDADRDGVLDAIGSRPMIESMPRERWIALLKRAAVIVGNSSSGLIECAALGVPCVNIGPRQSGRERCRTVIDVDEPEATVERIGVAITEATRIAGVVEHPYGAGEAGRRIAQRLAEFLGEAPSNRKRNAY